MQIRHRPIPHASTHAHDHEKAKACASLLLGLPLEIRRQIYEATLGLSLTDQLALLSTNRRICYEGRQFLFRRPLVCSSRSRLQTFAKNHSPNVLEQIQTLKLRLGEPSAAAMQVYLRNVMMGIPVSPTDHPFMAEVHVILACLRMMPNIKHLVLLPPRQRSQNAAPKDMVQYLLARLHQHLKQLRLLSICVDFKTLDFLTTLPRLRSLRFSGCSETESQTTKLIMTGCTDIQELTLVGPSKAFFKRQRQSQQKGKITTITPEILCDLHPLTKLTIRDLGPATPTFLTSAMLTAIFETHQATLQSLRISCLVQPEASVLALLKTAIQNLPRLHELSLEWPAMDPEFLPGCLPPSIQDLTVAVQSCEIAQKILDNLTACAHRFRLLRTICFALVSAREDVRRLDDEQLISYKMLTQASQSPSKSPWRTSWAVWQPTGDDDV